MTAAAEAQSNLVRSPLYEFWRRFRRQKIAVVAGLFLIALIFVAIFADFIAPYSIVDMVGIPIDPPSADNWLGVDELGRDVLSRIIVGTRISLSIGFLSVTVGAIVGVTLGLIAGFYGGKLDNIIMRFCDVLLSFPGIVLAIAMMAMLLALRIQGHLLIDIANVVVAVALFSVPVFARLVRGSTLSLKTSVYVDAARAIGVRDSVIMLRHILPGTLPSIIVYFSMRIGTAILTAASLGFLGVGVQPPSPEWGRMLADSRSYFEGAPHLVLYPGLAIFVTVLAFNLLGDGLRDALDPKLKQG